MIDLFLNFFQMEFPYSNYKKATELGDFIREIIMKKFRIFIK